MTYQHAFGGFVFFRSGLYFPTLPASSTGTSNTLGNGTMRLAPFPVSSPITITRIVGEMTAAGDAGSTLRLGIYSDDGNGYPNALLFDQGATLFTDAVLNSTTTLTSATANFTAADTGRSISGTGIPASTTMTFVNSTTVTLSNAATATASGVSIIMNRALKGDSATVQESALSLVLQPGLYWAGGVLQGVSSVQPTVRTVGGSSPFGIASTSVTAGTTSLGYQNSSITGALPSTFSTSVAPVGGAPRIFVKVA